MAKGPIITDETKRIIAEVYLQNPDLRAKEVQVKVDQILHGRGPGLSAVQKMLTDVRRLAKESEESGKGLEAPWSLAESVKHGMPFRANKDLLRIWKWCTIVGRRFTVREAKWVIHLAGVVPRNDLLRTAGRYALRERSCEVLGITLYTTDLDASLAFNIIEETWVYQTAERLEAIPRWRVVTAEEGDSWLLPENLSFTRPDLPPSLVVEQGLGVGTNIKMHEHPEDENIVYALWLRQLSTGPNWQAMSKEAKRGVMERLREEVVAAGKEMAELREAFDRTKSEITSPVEEFGRILVKTRRWRPSRGLLEEVGIWERGLQPLGTYESPPADSNWMPQEFISEYEEEKDERSHSQEE